MGDEPQSAQPYRLGASVLAHRRYPSWPRVLGRPRRRTWWPRGLLPLTSWVLSTTGLVIVLYLFPLFRAAPQFTDETWGDDFPFAENGVDLELGPIVRLDAAGVTLDGRRMATREELESGQGAIPALVDDLRVMTRNWSILHPRDPFPGVVLIGASADVPYGHVRRVVTSAWEAGYPHTSFVVRTPDDRLPIDTDEFARAIAQ